MSKWLVIPLLASLTACQTFKGEKEEVPPGVVVRTEKVEVIRKVYVPIDADLTKRCPWKRNAKPSESLKEMVIRAGCLKFYEGNLGEIERIQGKAK